MDQKIFEFVDDYARPRPAERKDTLAGNSTHF